MNELRQRLLTEALERVDDECVFAPDQSLYLRQIIERIFEAIESASEEE